MIAPVAVSSTCAAALLCTAGLLAATPGAEASASHTTSVTVLLAAPHPAALRVLGKRHGLTRRQRRDRLAPLLPSTSTRHDLVATLRNKGFTVTGQSTWTVTASASKSTVEDTLGTTTASGGLSDAGALGSGVASVVDDDAEPDLHPLAATTGADYRNAYAPATGSASSGRNDAASTVATIQLSNWDSADLSYYATHVLGTTDPVSSGQYTSVAVDGGTTDTDGSGEVDLDQESILATAPSAKQRAYIAPNSLAGFVDAYAAVASDAAANGTTAVSVSWGSCESGWSSDAIDAMEDVLASVNAAGVTVFGATGDAGIYDCGGSSTTASVDYPASSPQVLAVGGTTLTSLSSPSTVNTGSNWSETGWSCTTARSCSRNGGTGGGASAAFSQPTWQTDSLPTGYASGSSRLVPDVAAVGDPATGFTTYTRSGADATYGGTSLASPVAAASLANALGDAGATSHPGDIHAALYTAYTKAGSSVFRDVVSGQNGATSDRGDDPSVTAAVGYDTVSGLGSVYWPALLPYLGITTGTTGGGGDSTDPIPTAATPRISGTARVGSRLAASPGSWTSGTTFTYQWRALGRTVSTASSWTPTAGYRGHTLQLLVTGHHSGYTDVTRTSASVTIGAGLLSSGAPTILGVRRVGRTLRASHGTWTTGTTLRQAWYVGGHLTSRAATLHLTRAMRGKRVVVRVTGSKSGYTSATRVSAATAPIRRR